MGENVSAAGWGLTSILGSHVYSKMVRLYLVRYHVVCSRCGVSGVGRWDFFGQDQGVSIQFQAIFIIFYGQWWKRVDDRGY